MGEINDNQHSTDPLRLDRCPDCGYLFTGLPEAGRCPECGFVYDTEMIVLYGWTFGLGMGRPPGRSSPQSQWLDMLMWSLLAAMFLWFFYESAAQGRQGLLDILSPLTMLLFFGFQIWNRVSRHGDENGTPARQVRLQPQGLAMRNGIGRVRLRPWRKDTLLEMRMAGNCHGRLRIGRRWLGLAVYVVAVEFPGNVAAVEELRRRIQRWCPTTELT